MVVTSATRAEFTFKCPTPANVFETATKPLRFFFSLLAGTSKSYPSFFLTLLTSKRTSRHNGLHFFLTLISQVFREGCVLHILTSKLVSRHNGVDLFGIGIPKVLRDRQFDSIWLPNLFRATAVCNFSFLISLDGSALAALTSLVFDPPELQITRKMYWFATGLPFCGCSPSSFWCFLFSDLLVSSLLFSDSSHLCVVINLFCRKFDFSIYCAHRYWCFSASLLFNITSFALKYLEDLRERDEIELHQPGLLSVKDCSNTVAPGRTIESKQIRNRRYTIFCLDQQPGPLMQQQWIRFACFDL